MKLTIFMALTLGLSAWTTFAQSGPGGPRGPGGGRFPMDPLMAALDANTNRVIEATEVANAGEALKKLDKNSDGKLSSDELKPQRPGGGNQPGFTPPGGGRSMSPLVTALDANSDGELDAAEISNASAALKKLDTNGDGQLARDEVMPKRPDGFGGPGGPPRRAGDDQ